MLHIQSFTHNPFQENTWLIWEQNGDCIIIDPGCYTEEERNQLADFIRENSLNPVQLINTHCHIDHVLGNPFVHRKYGLTPEIHPLELPLFNAVEQYGTMWGIRSEAQPEPQLSLEAGQKIKLGASELSVIFTPGHSPGEICLYCEQQQFLIAGDVLFHESIGRTDLPGGNHKTLLESINRELMILPDEVSVHPGHGPSTTIGHERGYNPFLRA
jgi:glyoxylase-like metal-dependent hydrolase (beta-lactamase superfamily II)